MCCAQRHVDAAGVLALVAEVKNSGHKQHNRCAQGSLQGELVANGQTQIFGELAANQHIGARHISPACNNFFFQCNQPQIALRLNAAHAHTGISVTPHNKRRVLNNRRHHQHTGDRQRRVTHLLPLIQRTWALGARLYPCCIFSARALAQDARRFKGRFDDDLRLVVQQGFENACLQARQQCGHKHNHRHPQRHAGNDEQRLQQALAQKPRSQHPLKRKQWIHSAQFLAEVSWCNAQVLVAIIAIMAITVQWGSCQRRARGPVAAHPATGPVRVDRL